MADEIRAGNRNPRNLYREPTAAGHFAVVVGELGHAAEMSDWLADAARAHVAAGHPMPEPVDLRAELEQLRFRNSEVEHQLARALAELRERTAERDQLRTQAPPLPDSETEWGMRDRHGQVHSVGVENETQARSMLSMTPVRREVGPWIEVTS